MRILAVADFESRYIWDYFDPTVFKGVDMIISCGDLKSFYLSFLVTMIPAPLFYVCGNHDKNFDTHPPLGCESVEGRVVEYKGLRIGGLGGSRGSKPDSLLYTEAQMAKRVRRLESEVKKKKGIDIFMTHSPAIGVGDGKDETHKGYECFLNFNAEYKPKLHLFGHLQLSGSPVNRGAVFNYGSTTAINVSGYRLIDL
jgi:Icc-related predicted phosphoesterase